MSRHPLLLVAAGGLVALSLCWAAVFAVTVMTPEPQPSVPPVAIVPIEPAPTSPPESPTVEPTFRPVVTGSPVPSFRASVSGDAPTPTPSPSPSPLPTPTTFPTPAATPTQTPPPPTEPPPEPTPPTEPPPEPTPLPEIAIRCANGVDNGGGTGTICQVVIGPASATVLECHGAAGDPRAACALTTYSGRVTSVEACDGTANGGGATLRCSVTGVGAGTAPVTLCVGTGAGGTLVELTCTGPETAGVAISLCNGSGNGGGALVICSVRE